MYAVEPSGDFLMVFYSANIDQSVLPVGFTIYPKQGKYSSKSLPYFDQKLNPLCYPLLFPRGEMGWTWHKYSYVTPIHYELRLNSLVQQGYKWDGELKTPNKLDF